MSGSNLRRTFAATLIAAALAVATAPAAGAATQTGNVAGDALAVTSSYGDATPAAAPAPNGIIAVLIGLFTAPIGTDKGSITASGG
jgi:hypothetical protein